MTITQTRCRTSAIVSDRATFQVHQPSNDGCSSGATATLAPQSSITTTYLHHIHAILKLQRGIILCGRSVAEACS